MEPIATISGLATGIDFRGLVDQIMAAESRPLLTVQSQIADVTVRSAAWEDFRLRIGDLRAAAAALSTGSSFQLFSTSVNSGTGPAPFTVGAGPGAQVGGFDVTVAQLARAEKLGTDIFSSRTQALGISGEFLAAGQRITIDSENSLDDIATQINAAARTAGDEGVTASVMEISPGSFRMVLTAGSEGAAGMSLVDGASTVLRSLGLLGDTTALKHATSDGALSDRFASQTDPVGDQLDFSTLPASGSVTMGSIDVTIELATMSLDDIAGAINAAGGPGSVEASVVIETGSDGTVSRRLDISGTTTFVDNGGILEALGVVSGDRDGVAQEVTADNGFTAGDASTVLTSTDRFGDVWVGGADAGVSTGDTLSITGTRSDGSTFEKTFVVDEDDELSVLLSELNSSVDGFQAGGSTATASIDAQGRLVVTDDVAGTSLLDLQIVANNESGATLDFGAFEVTEVGQSSVLVEGSDAELIIDGSRITRSSNTIANVIDGVTFNLLSTTSGPVSASIQRDTEAIVSELQAFVDAYNAVSEFVQGQFSGAGAAEGVENAPLSGDSTVLQMRNLLRDAMNTLVGPEIGDLPGLFAVGIEVDRDGMYSLDQAKLEQALADDPDSVERLFTEYGVGSVGTLEFVGALDGAAVGSYDVDVTQAASRALVVGTGFGGTYVDDGTADTLTVVDTGSGYSYDVSLTNGMTMADIVATLNAEFGTLKQHEVQSDGALYSDGVGTFATEATVLQDLHDGGGGNAGIANGDVITVSGMTPDGVSAFAQFTVTDAATQTLGDVAESIASAMGGQVEVTLGDGVFAVTVKVPGQSLLSLNVSSDNAGGGSLTFGSFNDIQPGRGVADITASDVGGQLQISHDFYGAGNGIDVSYAAGGSDGSASLGLAAGSYSGQDVQGTINGIAATGTGSVLRGDTGTAVDGFQVSYIGSDTGQIGSVTYSRGVGAAMEAAADVLLSSGFGSIDEVVEGLDLQINLLNGRALDMESRLERRRESLILEFTRLEEAMSIAQAQSEFLANQLAGLQGLLGQ